MSRQLLAPVTALASALALFSCGGADAPRRPAVPPPARPLIPAPAPAAVSQPAPEPEPAPAPAPPPAPPPKPMLTTKQFQTWIWEKPRIGSQQVGFFRAGSRIVRTAEVDPKDPKELPNYVPCGGTWWKVEPIGYVCEGRDGVTKDLDDATVVAAAKYPPRNEALPYGYGMTTGAVMYTRIPTEKEQREAEGDVAAWRKTSAEARAKLPPEKRSPEVALPIADPPSFLENHAHAPPVLPYLAQNKSYRAGWAYYGVRLAFVAAFDVPFGETMRPFYLTTEHVLVPADKVVAAQASDFHGVELGDREKLPMIWVRFPNDKIPANVYKLVGDVATKTEIVLPNKAHYGVTKDDLTIKGTKWHELLELPKGAVAEPGAKWVVRPSDVARIDAATSLPTNVKEGETWVEVTIHKQTLVVYQGLTPKFATLVSTGAGGKNHVTPVGAFRVYQKHISSRMSAEGKPEKDGEPAEHAYRFDDVPWVQYVVGGIALHAAFWHDGFGLPRSHGCVNLSPADAKYVFERTLPVLPQGWHGMIPGYSGTTLGTMVVIRG